ncbi:unnamed protein product, partial [Acanthocheilonema viteae]
MGGRQSVQTDLHINEVRFCGVQKSAMLLLNKGITSVNVQLLLIWLATTRRPRSDSVADATAVSASASANHRNSHLIAGIGSISNLRGRIGNDSTSDSDEDAPGTSVLLNPGSSADTRPVGFSVSHLRTHRGSRDAPARRSMPVLQLLS